MLYEVITDMIEELLKTTVELISACPCDLGCPSCIHSPKCGGGNKPLDKTAALFLARGLLGEFPLELKLKEDDQFVITSYSIHYTKLYDEHQWSYYRPEEVDREITIH